MYLYIGNIIMWMMTWIIGILFGIITGFLCWWTLPVVSFVQKMESGEECLSCETRKKCFGQRKTFWSKYTNLEQWMMISTYRIRSYCHFVQKSALYPLAICICSAVVIMILFFWSNAVSIQTILYGITISVLCVLSVVDWNTQYIPLECNIIIFICGLIHLFADFSNWGDYIIGLFAVSGFLLLIDRLSVPVLRRKYEEELDIDDHVVGDGDIKLMAATGLLLGWKLNFIALGIGCVAGSVIHLIRMKIKGSNAMLALGPYLSLGVYITMICGEQLVSWYLNMLGIKPL